VTGFEYLTKGKNKMSASYGGQSSSSRWPVVLGILGVAFGAHAAIYEWGEFKVSKMLPVYPDKPRTVESAGPSYVSHLEANLAKAMQKISELSSQIAPGYRETKTEEKERWGEQKEHLLEHIAQLEAKLKETEEKLENIVNAYSDPIDDEDRAGLDILTGEGQS